MIQQLEICRVRHDVTNLICHYHEKAGAKFAPAFLFYSIG